MKKIKWFLLHLLCWFFLQWTSLNIAVPRDTVLDPSSSLSTEVILSDISNYIYARLFDIVPQVTEALNIFFSIFILCSSDSIVSIDLYSNSLNLASVISTLLLSPSKDYCFKRISDILFFSSRNFIGFFFWGEVVFNFLWEISYLLIHYKHVFFYRAGKFLIAALRS